MSGRIRGGIADNALALFFGVIFVAALIGQALTGVALYNNEQISSGLEQISTLQYVSSSAFAVDVTENWQSEYLQFFLYIYATVWLLQKGSPESKNLGRRGTESDADQRVGAHADARSPRWARAGGWRLTLYSRSLGLVMGGIFVLSWLANRSPGPANTTRTSCEASKSPSPGGGTRAQRTSGIAPCRTGSPNFWPWPRWWCSRSIYANAGRRSRSRSGARTSPPASKADLPQESLSSRCGGPGHQYLHDFPTSFASLDDARTFLKGFFNEYNHIHHHSGIGWHTPASVHFGTSDAIDEARQITLTAAFHANPARFSTRPTPPKIPHIVYINEPALETQIN